VNDDIRREIRRETRVLRGYAIVMTAAVGVLALAAFRTSPVQERSFTEIDVQRINIVEPDGKLRMVISNRPRSIGPIYKGKPFGYPGGRRPGIIFFNDEGTENGGLTFSGSRDAQGRYNATSGARERGLPRRQRSRHVQPAGFRAKVGVAASTVGSVVALSYTNGRLSASTGSVM
jgi:hypothetical protein